MSMNVNVNVVDVGLVWMLVWCGCFGGCNVMRWMQMDVVQNGRLR